MSGTSLDGLDAALVSFSPPRLLASHRAPFPASLQRELLALCRPGRDEIRRLMAMDVALGRLSARAVHGLLRKAGIQAEKVRAIGSHGQTIRHNPQGAYPSSLQIGDPNIIAELTGITTVADFRRRDMAAGGEGAPLVPAFHRAIFPADSTVVNIGGMANATCLAMDGRGFDTGPGNVLMDAWARRHLKAPFDQGGRWAASGRVHQGLLERLLSEPFFARPPPKSTGRELFNLPWLDGILAGMDPIPPGDVQATLAELTAASIAGALKRWSSPGRIWVCGGGVHNAHLMERLACLLSPCPVASTADLGVDPDWVEAMAFAWLARETLNARPGNVPRATGARHPALLGGIYPGCRA